jgi:hypothetical protein
MKKSILTLALLSIAFFSFGQAAEEPVVSRTAEIISYGFNILLLILGGPKLAAVSSKIAKLRDIFGSAHTALSEGSLSPSRQKELAGQVKQLFS